MKLIVQALLTLATDICPRCGWWAAPGHVCHPADR